MSGLIPVSRPLTVKSAAIPQVAGIPILEPLKLEGSEGINTLFSYELTLQTPDTLAALAGPASNLDLDAFIGLELTCCIELDGPGAGVREISGLIMAARLAGEDNRHAVYVLTLRPWLHLATLTSDCKVFQDLSAVEVIAAVLSDYPFASVPRLVESYPRRDYCVQYNETDFEFITRLMQQWGINYHFEHTHGVHRLVWSDHNASSSAQCIPFYPLGHKVDCEYIHGFSPVDRITSGIYATRDYNYLRPRATLEATATDPRGTGHAQQPVYQWRDDKPAYPDEEQGQMLARLRQQALRQTGSRARGVGHVRQVVPGNNFTLTGHPQAKANTDYLVLDTQLVLENAAFASGERVAHTDEQGISGKWRVKVAFEVQPASELLRPPATQGKPKTGGPETALVVGPGEGTAASNIFTDALGRIKVQFPWDRYGQKNQHSSCWLRVSSTWAGNQLGAMHLPRLGQEVLVQFLGGDPDLPVVVGRVVNQLNQPPWRLPEQQALSGFRSRELLDGGGNAAPGRSNHLVLDDTQGQIQAQLHSDHQHSSLSLGHISRVEDNAGRKDWRGEGFELRTDGHGVVRAAAGLLISTEARLGASGKTMDMQETTARLAQARDQHAQLADLARQHQAQDTAHTAKPLEETAPSHITLASPAGIAFTTPGCIHQHSGAQHAITSDGHTSISSGKSLLVSAKEAVRLFAYRSGMKLISAASDIHINALSASIQALAKMDITLTASSIELKASKQVLVNGGGSFMRWNGDAITEGTAGTRTVHATSFPVLGPDNQPVPPVTMPNGTPTEFVPETDLSFTLLRHAGDGKPVAYEPYVLYRDGAEMGRGVTDANGRLIIKNHQESTASYSVELFHGGRYELPVTETHQSLQDTAAAQGYRAAFGDEKNRLAEFSRDNDVPLA